jgi:SNF2 family DNA or RNA helicase
MGLGKTIQTLCYLDQAACLGHKPALIVCPASVLPIWQEELDRHFPEVPVKVLRKDCPFEAQDKPSACLWLASYTQLRRHRSALAAIEFDHAVLDEAQNIKNPDAKVTHACLAIRARHRLALTGTPMENRPLDLWTLFRFLMPGLLGNRSRFETQQRSDPNFISSLRARLRPFILRRLKLAVATDLPPKVEVTLHCPLTETQRRLYTAACSRASNSISAELSTAANQQRMHLFALLTELRQICCDPGLKQPTAAWQQSGKLNQLIASMHDPVASGSRIVVFSQFVRLLQRARAAVRACFPDVPQFQLTGATRKRAEVVQRFTSSDGPAVFFVSLKAGGTGLNLQAADYLFLLDPWWNPAAEAQAIDRIHRIGQQNQVFIYRLITKGTIENRVELLKSNKAALLQSLLPENAADQSLWEHFQSLDALIQLDDTVKSSAEG